MALEIPSDFELGVATAAWQIEGDVAGRGPCIWDDFARIPGAIVDGATGEPACDHVHRLTEDLDLLGWLGVDAYRFSFSWPRVMPDGVGATSPEGLGFYDRLIDGLLERGIRPVATLYHWDLPSPLEAAGGWPVRDTAYRFADYAEVLADRYADRVDRWATLNEPWCSAFLGYCSGTFAPGRVEPEASLAAIYHLMLGHGLAVERLRADLDNEDACVTIARALIPEMGAIYVTNYRHNAKKDVESLRTMDHVARHRRIHEHRFTGLPTEHIDESFRRLARRMVDMIIEAVPATPSPDLSAQRAAKAGAMFDRSHL